MSWSCPIFTVLSFPTLVPLSLADQVSFQDAMSEGSVVLYMTRQLLTRAAGVCPLRTRMPTCCLRHHGNKPGQPHCHDPQRHHDVATPRVGLSRHCHVLSLTWVFSLDKIANSIAAATFDVINEKKVRTADMGGKSHQFSECYHRNHMSKGSSTTSDVTAEIIRKL